MIDLNSYVYFNARFWGTLGKLAVGICVSKPDGTPISWLESWKRSSVDIIFALIALTVEISALLQIPTETFSSLTWINRVELQQTLSPDWFFWINLLMQIWVWSELIVLLFNKRKRAIHDYIAGTVVIKRQFFQNSQSSSNPDPMRD
ncbi:MAG: RDD family protein [Verrucomicrobiales bacterium]|nr:RDD family protein [Verrucomicrobiales bacterium]